jgi:signal transduction histidine kinase
MESVTDASAATSDGTEPSTTRWPATMSLRRRLSALMAIGALLLAIAVALCTIAFVHLVDARHTLLAQVYPANLASDQLLVAFLNEETGVRGYVLSGNPQFLEPSELGFTQQRTAESQLGNLLVGQPTLQRLTKSAEATGALWQHRYALPAITAVAHGPTGDTSFSSQAALLQSKKLFDAVRTSFTRLDAAFAATKASSETILNSATSLLVGVLVGTLVMIVLAGLAGRWLLRRWVTAPLLTIGADVQQVATGQVDHPVPAAGPPELQHLADDVELMRQRIVAELEETRTAQSQLSARNLDLSRSNTELEQFAYVASHDLQEPLRKVTSFVQLLQQRYQGELDERADQYIGFAVDGAKRMQVLINDLLGFSRVGRTTDQFGQVDLAASVEAALDNLTQAIQESGATVEVGQLPVVRGDAGLLATVFQNLIGNAIKFHSEAPPVITVAATPSPEGWVCSVTDNGIGVEPRFGDKIFVIFQRLHSREAYEGTGIGLALSKKIIEFHGGRIWLDTQHQSGTRLCFTLPVSPQVGRLRRAGEVDS